MGSLSDTMLQTGMMPCLESVHGETILVLSGDDAGKSFTAINEIEPDINLESELLVDPRAKRILRFTDRPGNVPQLKKLDKFKTSDGKVWTATLRPGSAYLSVDFELAEVSKKDN